VSSSRPEPSKGGLSSQPSTATDWYGADLATQRGTDTSVAAPVVVPSPDRPLLKVLVGLNAGQLFPLDQDETVIGRSRDADVHVDDVGISRRHARIIRERGRYVLEDLCSTNGILLNGHRVALVDLADGDRVQLGSKAVLRFAFIAPDEEALARKLYDGSTRDALTSAYNRKYVGERLASEVAYANRHETALSLAMLDLDHFKRVNDTFGHLAGDVVLRAVVAQAAKSIRAEDALARYGGEEFVVLVRGIDLQNVGVMAERIRRNVEQFSIPWDSRAIQTTVSIGVASLSECGPKATAETLVALADKRLYEAKAGGRNRVRGGPFMSLNGESNA